MPTLQDVAQKAGVSVATVSKVLSNRPYFTEETRDKVMDAVKELGYTPNLTARALSTGRTGIIGVVFPYIYDAIFKDPLTMLILEGIENESTRRGYNLLLSTPRITEEGTDVRYRELIRSGYMDGVIALDNVPMASVLTPIDQQRTPVVVIGYHPANYYVHSDDHAGGATLMRHILDLGHRRFGLISVPDNMNFAVNARMKGIQTVVEAAGLDFKTVPVVFGDFSAEGGALMAERLMTQHPDLTAILCLNDRMAFGAVQRLHDLGYGVPADVTVVGYDNISVGELLNPPLTTISQMPTDIGETAARMLFELLQGEKPSPVVLPTRLITRGSSAAPRLT